MAFGGVAGGPDVVGELDCQGELRDVHSEEHRTFVRRHGILESEASLRSMDRTDIHAAFVRRYSVPAMDAPAPVTLDALRAVEEELRTTFPVSYLSFIVKHGPVFTPDLSQTIDECVASVPPEEEIFAVREFLTPEQIARDYHTCTAGGMPDFIVPFAADLGGHAFGFRREVDHDYCVVRSAGESFDSWLEYFLSLKA